MAKKPYPPAPVIAAGHKNMVFVAVPNERNRYMRAHVCVAYVTCEQCGAKPGEPCKNLLRVSGKVSYSSDTHYLRRAAFQKIRIPSEKAPIEPVAQDDEETSGQLWVLGRVLTNDADRWEWYSGFDGWRPSHYAVSLFPSKFAADAQMSVFVTLKGRTVHVLSLAEAQEIWQRLHKAATTEKGKA